MLKTAFLLSALTFVSASAVLAAPPAPAHNPSHQDTLTYSSNAAVVPVLPEAGNPNEPGATGRAIVRGDNSTIAGDRAATLDFRSGSYGAD